MRAILAILALPLAWLLAGCVVVTVVAPPPAPTPAPTPACPILELERVTIDPDGRPTVWLVVENPAPVPAIVNRASVTLHDGAGVVYRAEPEARAIPPGGELGVNLTAPEGTLPVEARLDAAPCPPAVVTLPPGRAGR